MTCHEFVMNNHNRSDNKIYRIVPSILKSLLHDHPELAGFVLGGSYANGEYKSGDDIDADVIFDTYPNSWKGKLGIEEELRRVFMQHNLTLYIRLSVATDTIPTRYRLDTYTDHQNSPYIVRNIGVVKAWGLAK